MGDFRIHALVGEGTPGLPRFSCSGYSCETGSGKVVRGSEVHVVDGQAGTFSVYAYR